MVGNTYTYLDVRAMKYEFACVKNYLADFQFNLKCLEYQKLKHPERSSEKSLQNLNRSLSECIEDLQRGVAMLNRIALESIEDQDDNSPSTQGPKKKKQQQDNTASASASTAETAETAEAASAASTASAFPSTVSPNSQTVRTEEEIEADTQQTSSAEEEE